MDNWQSCLQILRQSNYQNGWPRHEWIPAGNRKSVLTPTFDKPIWKGEVEPITLLINADFGLGDTIQHWRFIPETVKRVNQVILRCDEDLHSLFSTIKLISKEDPLPTFNKVAHMMTLPKTNISGEAYLEPKPPVPELVRNMPNFTKIGICWTGNPFNPRDHLRSIPVELTVKMFQSSNIRPFSLVKHIAPPQYFLDARGLMKTWNDTAHLLKQLDLIITVDTAIAHLAGALGRPTWLLLSKNPEWRWSLSEKTIWYQSIQIFHQKNTWDDVLERVEEKLKEL